MVKAIFRTEASHKQGMGDLWGSIALADQCAKSADELLFVLSDDEAAKNILEKRGYSYKVVDSWQDEKELLSRFSPDVIIVNKLNNPETYIKSLKNFGALVVTMDDAGEGSKWADLKINVLYPVEGAMTEFGYLALRNEFQKAHRRKRTLRAKVSELLIAQGGSDTYGFLSKIVKALDQMVSRPHCTVVAGPAFRHGPALETAIQQSALQIDVVRNPPQISEYMERADLAITAGGLSMYELACVGTPSVVVCAEPFEVASAERMQEAGTVINLGFGGDLDYRRIPAVIDHLANDFKQRQTMSLNGKQIVDGKGAERIMQSIKAKLVHSAKGQR